MMNIIWLPYILVLVIAFDENERLGAPGKDKDAKKKIRKGTLKIPGAVDMLKPNDYFEKKVHPPLEAIDTESKENADEKVKALVIERVFASKELKKQEKENRKK